MSYPKINSLYERCFTKKDPVTGQLKFLNKGVGGNPLIIGKYASQEFGAIHLWHVTEKIDGTNIWIDFSWHHKFNLVEGFAVEAGKDPIIEFHGRTDAAQIPSVLVTKLRKTFTEAKMAAQFPEALTVQLYGEGYGPKIQCEYGRYSDDVGFVLFDAKINEYWLDREKLEVLAMQLEIPIVPLLKKDNGGYLWTETDIVEYVKSEPISVYSTRQRIMEGVVARSVPCMLFRESKDPIMFKLKGKDFREPKS